MKKKLKVCHLTSAHTRFDVRIFWKECVALANQNWEVSLVVADGLPDEEVRGVRIFGVPEGSSVLDRYFRANRNVYSKAVLLDADIYHFHDPELLPYGNKLERMGKIVIFDSHEDFPRQILGKTYLPELTRKSLANIVEWYEEFCCKKYAAIVTATPHINQRFAKINKNSANVNNYPFLDEFKAEETDWLPQPNSICYIGGVSKVRGLEQVVKALAMVDASLEMAGGFNPTGYKDELAELDGWDRVVYHGSVSRTQVKEILSRSLAGVVTFLPYPNHVNAQPNKLFEYMSSGLPVIASNYPLWRSIVEEYDCGICVDPENIDDIARAIKYLADNPAKAATMGRNGRKAVEEVFNWEHEVGKLIELYSALGNSDNK